MSGSSGALGADVLRRKLKARAAGLDEGLRIRVHRATSWIARAQAETTDADLRVILHWIAFNAAYARELGHERSEREKLGAFFRLLHGLDAGGRLQTILFERFSGPIRTMIDNRYVFEPFWRALRDHDSSDAWSRDFDASKKAAMHALLAQRTDVVLEIVFDRLYVLRNQLVHGGATWNSQVNRAQVRDGANILGELLPVIVDLMLDHPDRDFGETLYPVLPG